MDNTSMVYNIEVEDNSDSLLPHLPRQPKHPCGHPLCPELTNSRFCPTHTTKYDRTTPRHGHDLYRTRKWRRTRAKVLHLNATNNSGRCVIAGCQNLANTVDHIIPLRDGGAPFDMPNLQPLCAKHHSEKTMREVFRLKNIDNNGYGND